MIYIEWYGTTIWYSTGMWIDYIDMYILNTATWQLHGCWLFVYVDFNPTKKHMVIYGDIVGTWWLMITSGFPIRPLQSVSWKASMQVKIKQITRFILFVSSYSNNVPFPGFLLKKKQLQYILLNMSIPGWL